MKEKKPSYLAAAFGARPFGMPVPPHLFGVAAFGLLGALVDPAFWMIGAGIEGLYLFLLSTNARFRRTVDARGAGDESWDARYGALAQNLDEVSRREQDALERKAREIVAILGRSGAHESQIGQVRQMVWLHLKLLAARASFIQVIHVADREQRSLEEQERSVEARIHRGDADDELKRSLEQQLAVIRSRREGHQEAARRCELVDAELARLRQQISLVREQALLATDENSVASSLDAVSASLNEANRWLREQRDLFAGIDELDDEPPPPELLRPKSVTDRRSRERVSE
jgi:hypothetical protein